LAAALAKAQGELVNPEKSLVATIRADGRGGGEKTFRYAPLSSGLDIVRKVLGQHEIATVQTTSLDQTAGVINLTTLLAHSSGEWIASDWPVCPISETAAPHRMGAALTYARRYALFTLVGIAGEDDLDAPDLMTPTSEGSGSEKPKGSSNNPLNGGQPDPRQRAPLRRDRKVHATSAKPILEPDASVELRNRLLAELNELRSGDDAATWAHRCLGQKSRLIEADAQRVEEAFQAKLATVATCEADAMPSAPAESKQPLKPDLSDPSDSNVRPRPKGVDKSMLALPEPRRIRDRAHVKSVAKQPCLVCGRRPSDAHHLRFVQRPALGRKASDEFMVPLCRGHHREVHRCGDEAAWWNKAGIDPSINARALWLETHPLPTTSDKTSIEGPTSVVVDTSRGGGGYV